MLTREQDDEAFADYAPEPAGHAWTCDLWTCATINDDGPPFKIPGLPDWGFCKEGCARLLAFAVAANVLRHGSEFAISHEEERAAMIWLRDRLNEVLK